MSYIGLNRDTVSMMAGGRTSHGRRTMAGVGSPGTAARRDRAMMPTARPPTIKPHRASSAMGMTSGLDPAKPVKRARMVAVLVLDSQLIWPRCLKPSNATGDAAMPAATVATTHRHRRTGPTPRAAPESAGLDSAGPERAAWAALRRRT